MSKAISSKLAAVFRIGMFTSIFILIGAGIDTGDTRIRIATYLLVVLQVLAEHLIAFHHGFFNGYEEALDEFESWVDDSDNKSKLARLREVIFPRSDDDTLN